MNRESDSLPDSNESLEEGELTVEQLQSIASQDQVHGRTLSCLNCLLSQDEDVRAWAAESLSASIKPDHKEADALLAFLTNQITQWQRWFAQPEPNVDTERHIDLIYWSVTMVGRLEESSSQWSTDAKSLLTEIAGWQNRPGFAAAADRAAVMATRC